MKGRNGCKQCQCSPEDNYCSCLCHENELCSEKEDKEPTSEDCHELTAIPNKDGYDYDSQEED
jgi:hypothetical protein